MSCVLALVAFLFVAMCVLSLSCLLVLLSTGDSCEGVLQVGKNCLMSLMLVDVLRFFSLFDGPVGVGSVSFCRYRI